MSQPRIPRAALEEAHDFAASGALVERTVAAAVSSPEALVRFLGRYASWNGFFGSGVASLAGRIGRTRAVFADPDQPVGALADRSVFVASFFFDAARDEFDDRDTPHRDTHRCLAQSLVSGVLTWHHLEAPERANALLAEPEWLQHLNRRVARSYGEGTSEGAEGIFWSMGYHLGSEVLADQEFSVIDAHLRRTDPAMVAFLEDHRVEIAGREHIAYAWLRIHSGHGGAVEADHFEWAVQGVELGFRYSDPAHHAVLEAAVIAGFQAFAADHAEFFAKVGEP